MDGFWAFIGLTPTTGCKMRSRRPNTGPAREVEVKSDPAARMRIDRQAKHPPIAPRDYRPTPAKCHTTTDLIVYFTGVLLSKEMGREKRPQESPGKRADGAWCTRNEPISQEKSGGFQIKLCTKRCACTRYDRFTLASVRRICDCAHNRSLRNGHDRHEEGVDVRNRRLWRHPGACKKAAG